MVIEETISLVSSQFQLIKTCLSITRLEAKLAGLSVYPLLILVCLLMVCFMGLWCSIFCFLGYVLLEVLGHLMLVMGLLCLIHAVFVGIILRCLHVYLKRMSFEKTRAYLSGEGA